MIESILQRYLDQASPSTPLATNTSSGGLATEKLQAESTTEAINLLVELIALIRPKRASNTVDAVNAVQALCFTLNQHPQYAHFLRDIILKLIKQHRSVSIFVDSGIQPSSGFFSEITRRISHKMLPEVLDKRYLKDIFSQLFCQPSDDQWVLAVPDAVWLQLVDAIRFHEADKAIIEAIFQQLLEAAQILSYRLSAAGLEPELLKNHEHLETHHSPFITQNIEISAVVNAENATDTDISHVLIMLSQCTDIITKIRKNSAQTGTSIRLTFLLQRMTQQLDRLENIFHIVVGLKNQTCVKAASVCLFKKLVYSECNKNDVGMHFRENIELIALRVTENASRTGEHYITESRTEYFRLMRSAMGAGVIIGVMAMIKILVGSRHLAPLMEAIVFSLNYGLGFVLIHILHFTVATKQPAMTAATIAAAVDNHDGKTKELDKLVSVIAQTMRSQAVAIFGNVVMVVPMAMMIAWLVFTLTGQHFVTVEKAQQLLADIQPFDSPALMYAAIAGVCLFLSGLIAGYHDNLAIYNKIPQRLMALKWLQKLLGQPRLNRVATYLENNLGALAGNFYFGCLLGGMAAVGVLLGLPIDIRHITFSSAFVGFSFVGLDFNVTWQTVRMAVAGVLLIGLVNLMVSFSLALYVAMKSRKVSFAQWRLLFGKLLSRLNQQPAEFLFPPKAIKAKLSDVDVVDKTH